MKIENPDHPALQGQYCPGCGRHCPASDPTCKRGVAFGERLIREYDGAAQRTPRLFDTIEEYEAYHNRS